MINLGGSKTPVYVNESAIISVALYQRAGRYAVLVKERLGLSLGQGVLLEGPDAIELLLTLRIFWPPLEGLPEYPQI